MKIVLNSTKEFLLDAETEGVVFFDDVGIEDCRS